MVNLEIQAIIEKAQLAVQEGRLDPQTAQMQIMEVQQGMQDPAQLEKLISMQELKLLEETMADLIPQGQSPMDDPLVQIRMQELGIKQQTEQRKSETDKADLMIEAQKMQQQAAASAAKIESTEEIAQNRNDVNRERIDVQRQRN
jgi:hypothetical protein